nr:threonine ammonia-lyase [Sphingomonas sp. Y57]
MPHRSIEFADIEAARDRIRDALMLTPCLPSRTLSQITGCQLHLKFENLQFTASFKERGALNKLLSLLEEGPVSGVCAMSAGNHAQGVAYHARRLALPAVIVMPRGTPLTKISRTRDHGAEVIVAGDNLSEALQIALSTATTRGLTFVHPFDDAAVIAGQGTVGIEILEQVDELDALVVPIGGGGLIAGIAVAVKALRPDLQLFGVQSATYPSMSRALRGEADPCPDGLTIAEGIAVKTAGDITRAVVRQLVDEIVLVEEQSIERAVALLLSVEKTVVEGAGAAGLAAILQHRERFAGRNVATILSGGNIDLSVISSVCMRELVRAGQLQRISVPISDQPGALSRLTAILGDEGANIFDVAHDRLSLSLNPKGAILDLVVQVQDSAHATAVLAALAGQGFAAEEKPVR